MERRIRLLNKMKTLSIKQPWAELILQGRKKIEIRKWNTSFRGEFLIHSSKIPDTRAMKKFGFNNLPCGFIIGKVELTDIKKYKNDKDFLEDKDLHLAEKGWGDKGFILKNPQRIKKIQHKGNLGFWDFNGEIKIENPVKSAASSKEITEIYECLKSMNLDYPNYNEWVEKCKKELESGYKKAFYLKENLDIVGVIIFQPHKEKKSTLEIKNFWVSLPKRKKGVGTSLLCNSLEQYAEKEKFGIIQMDTHNKELIEFLLKRGFKITGEEALYSPSQEETILQKNLTIEIE